MDAGIERLLREFDDNPAFEDLLSGCPQDFWEIAAPYIDADGDLLPNATAEAISAVEALELAGNLSALQLQIAEAGEPALREGLLPIIIDGAFRLGQLWERVKFTQGAHRTKAKQREAGGKNAKLTDELKQIIRKMHAELTGSGIKQSGAFTRIAAHLAKEHGVTVGQTTLWRCVNP